MHNLDAFRQIILERKSVRISYASQGRTEMLRYDHAGFHGEKGVVIRQLREIYRADDIHIAKFLPGKQNLLRPIPTVPAVAGIIKALNDFHVDEQTQERIKPFLHQLPPVNVKLVPLNRAGFKDFTSYLNLHQQMTQSGPCDMNAFIKEAGDETEEQRRFRVFLACYLLGLIPIQKQAAADDGNNSTARSNISSILQRIRGLYGRGGSDTQNVDDEPELHPRKEAEQDDHPGPAGDQPV